MIPRAQRRVLALDRPFVRTRIAPRQSLQFEQLEDRRLLANLTVTNLSDVVNGNVSSVGALLANHGGDGISLREAIMAANTDAAADVITFDAVGLLLLTNIGHPGELAITSDLTIVGPGAHALQVRAFSGTFQPGDGAQIFRIDDGNATSHKSIAISGLTLTGGDTNLASGGAIVSRENLTLSDCNLSGNQTTTGNGGAIQQSFGSLTIRSCMISNNRATRGGGISSYAADVTIENSTISNNTSTFTTGFGGGGILTMAGFATLSGSTRITNSTLSGNKSHGDGGGIYHYSGSLTIQHSTITGNRADEDSNGSGSGGGVYVRNIGTTFRMDHTIVAENRTSGLARDDISGTVTARQSMLGVNTGATIVDQGGNQIGVRTAPIDPLLGPLADLGGLTATHPLLDGSPAIDAGDPAAIAGVGNVPLLDQRGFPRIANGDNLGISRIDLGAFELPEASGGSFRGVPDVEAQFQQLKHHGEAVGWFLPHEQGAPDPGLFDHFQGIARYPGTGTPVFYVTQKAAGGGYLEVIRMGSRDIDGERLRSNLQVNVQAMSSGNTTNTLPPTADTWLRAVRFDGSMTIDDNNPRPYEHPGGMAIVDNILFVSLDTPVGPGMGGEGMIVLFDLGPHGAWREAPVPIQALSLDHKIDNLAVVKRSEPGPGTEESYLIWVNGDGGSISRFYKTTVLFPNPSVPHLRNDTLQLELVQFWDPSSADDFAPGNSSWPTGAGAHQSSTFIQEIDSAAPPAGAPLYMIAMRHDGPLGIPLVGEDYADLYRVTENASGRYKLTHVRTLHMFVVYAGADRIGNFAAGNNAYVSPTGELLLYSVQHDDQDVPGTDYVKMAEFRHRGVYRSDSPLRQIGSDAGGPYYVPEGHSVQLHGVGTPAADRPWVELFDDNHGWLHGFEHPNGDEGDRSIVVDYDDRHLFELNNFRYLDGFNDKTSSVRWRLPEGMEVHLFDDHDFQDTRRILEGTGRTESITDLDDFSFGDKTSSMRFVGAVPDASSLTYAWDLDGDGVFGETGADATRGDETTATPVFNAAGLTAPTTFVVALRVRGATGIVNVSTAMIHVTSSVITVNSLADGPVNLTDSIVTIRDALHAANHDLPVSPGGPVGSGSDEIRFQFGLSGTILLESSLQISSDVAILGPGANLLTVRGSGNRRVFDVTDGISASRNVAIHGLTVTGGSSIDFGGGMMNRENLTLRGVVVAGNTAGTSGGGVINLSGATLTVLDSAISGNFANTNGAGIYNQGFLFIGNSTVSGNSAREFGGGIFGAAGAIDLTHVTISNNRADSDAAGGGTGGGLHRHAGNVLLQHTIVADNFRFNGDTEDDVSGVISLASSFNLIGTGGAGGLIHGVDGNLVGVHDPRLGPLSNNGGPTQTHPLLFDSPAINKGNPNVTPLFSFDQRGATFSRISGNRIDMGAFEREITGVDADFNDDGLFDLVDIDALVLEIAVSSNNTLFDMTGDGRVDLEDRDAWLAEAGRANLGLGRVYRLGDANLDGFVDGSDFGIWNANKFTSVARWSHGDFTADGFVDGSDFGAWNTNKFTSSFDLGRPAGPNEDERLRAPRKLRPKMVFLDESSSAAGDMNRQLRNMGQRFASTYSLSPFREVVRRAAQW